MKFRSKVVEIEAVQLLWTNWSEVCELAQSSLRGQGMRGLTVDEVKQQFPGAEFAEDLDSEWIYAVIPTLEGPHLARQGDWIIRGTEGELYPCKPSVFERKYEPANTPQETNVTEQSIEQEIQAKGLTAARVTPQRIEDVIIRAEYHVFGGSTLTVCCLTLANGFTVTGESACASPANFNAELGQRIARDNAKQKIWALEGYLLRQALHNGQKWLDDPNRGPLVPAV